MALQSLLRKPACYLVLLLLVPAWAWSQSPIIDPAFRATTAYRPALVQQVLPQPDGKLLVLSNSTRVGRQSVGQVLRLLPGSWAPDSVFSSNARGLRGWVTSMTLLPGGKALLLSYDTLRLGAVSRPFMLCLNADGTPDAGFDAGLTRIDHTVRLLGQPDGRIVLMGAASFASGLSSYPLVRLLPDGRPDQAFNTTLAAQGLSAIGLSDLSGSVALQPDGKLLLAGRFGAQGVVRLWPTGAIDATFNAPALTHPGARATHLAVQPDGKVLFFTYNYSTGGAFPPGRLLPTGAADVSFQPTLSFHHNNYTARVMQVQPDGRILVFAHQGGSSATMLTRLEANGSLDTSVAYQLPPTPARPSGVHLLPSGQVLLSLLDATASQAASGLLLLRPTGTRDPSLAPQLQQPGIINDVLQLPGGGYLVGGDFTEINGVARPYLARLATDGTPDPAFPADAPDEEVCSLLRQPDGKLLLSGHFARLGTTARATVGRLLPMGTVDAGFAPPFVPSTTYRLPYEPKRLALLPDGRVLLTGQTQLPTGTGPENVLRRLDGTTGQPDLSLPNYLATDVLVQPNGQAVVAGFAPTDPSGRFGFSVFRLLASGQLDPGFTSMMATRGGFGGGPGITALAQDSSGALFCTGYYTSDTSLPSPYAFLYYLAPNGRQLGSVGNDRCEHVLSLAVQPGGHVLVGTDLASTQPTFGLSRLLPARTLDTGFAGANGPQGAYSVRRLLVQPDGAVLAAGNFTRVGGQAITGLVRLLAPTALAAATAATSPTTLAWPVPAHGQLHLALEAAARPSRVELLDALGRPVRTQAVAASALTLDLNGLPAGTYLLRVQYATGAVTRRVVLE